MGTNYVKYSIEGHIAHLILSRPEKRNAMNFDLWNDLRDAVRALEKEPDVRVVILRGEGPSFSSGLDTSPENTLFHVMTEDSKIVIQQKFYKIVREIQDIYRAVERLPFPVIAAINGHCLGIAMELVLTADFRVCSDDTIFAIQEVELGMIPDMGGCRRLVSTVGPGMTKELILACTRIDAAEALRIGLVNHVYPNDDLLNAATELAQRVADLPPLGVKHAKKCINSDLNRQMSESLEYAAQSVILCLPSEDVVEAFTSKIEKRKPEYKGR